VIDPSFIEAISFSFPLESDVAAGSISLFSMRFWANSDNYNLYEVYEVYDVYKA
jgi:hypothetical protein